MKVLIAFVAVACFAQSALSSWAGHGAYGGWAGHGGYHGPLAAPVVTPSGFLADTPEVAAAKAAHLSLVAHAGGAAAAGGPYAAGHAGAYAGAGAYHGPLAAPVVTPSGFLADTPEVAAAKAAHLSLLSHSGAAAGAPYAGAWGGYAGAGAGQWAGAGAGHWAEAGHWADPSESGQYVPSHNEGQYVPDQNHW